MTSIILASKSKVRKEILEKNGIKCLVVSSNIDEEPVKESLLYDEVPPEIISKNLAELKANKVSEKFNGELVLGADSVIDLNDELISKPLSRDNALEILNKLTSNIIGKKRLPMLIIDQESSNNNISKFSARVAAIRGFSVFSNEKCFALDDKMQLNQNLVMKFLDKYKNKKIMIFGFTSIIWENFLIFLIDKKIKLDLSDAFIIQIGRAHV